MRILSFLIVSVVLLSSSLQAQTWDELIKANALEIEANDMYGISVSISDNFAIVGAWTEDENALEQDSLKDAGSAYIFEKQNGVWTQVQKIVASDRAENDAFGISVAISGNYAFVGAEREDHDVDGNNEFISSGSVYIFERQNGSWVEVQKIVASDRDTGDRFGYSTSVSCDYAIVSAHGKDAGIGCAYIFERQNGSWAEVKKIEASDREAGDWYGYSVSISGNYAIVGAPHKNEGAITHYGGAYIYYKDQGGSNNWGQQQKIVALNNKTAEDWFGVSVSISGNYAIVGAYGQSYDADGLDFKEHAGSAYIFYKDQGGSNNWGQQQKIVASDRNTSHRYGCAVSISDDYAIVGAYSKNNSGGAYKLDKQNGIWSETQIIVPSDIAQSDMFGYRVTVSGNYAIASSPYSDFMVGQNNLGETGSIFLFGFAIASEITNITKNNNSDYSVDASITSLNNVAYTEHGIVWSTSQNPTLGSNQGITALGAHISGSFTFSSNATNLAVGPGYYVRAYATAGGQTYYSNQVYIGVVPTLPEWGLIILAGGFVIAGGWFMFRKMI